MKKSKAVNCHFLGNHLFNITNEKLAYLNRVSRGLHCPMNNVVMICVSIFPALATLATDETFTMAETLIEEVQCSRKRLERQIIVHQLTPPLPRHLKLLLASTVFLVILVLGTIVYFIYAKYANEWHRRELRTS